MEIVLSLAVAGVMVGTLYGLLGFTVTLTFRSTGVLSFAPAGFGLIAAYMYTGFSCRSGSRGTPRPATRCSRPTWPRWSPSPRSRPWPCWSSGS